LAHSQSGAADHAGDGGRRQQIAFPHGTISPEGSVRYVRAFSEMESGSPQKATTQIPMHWTGIRARGLRTLVTNASFPYGFL
jgi:hypothetical protein